MRLAGYIRVSRVGGREGETFLSPEMQREAILAYATAHRHEIVAWQQDLDVPGSRLKRPGLDATLAAIDSGQAQGIIVARLDRLTRSVSDLKALLKQADENGWNLVAVDLGLDLKTRNGRLVAGLLTEIAEWFLEGIAEGFDSAQAQAVARGVHISSRAPTGYARRDTNGKTGRPSGPLVLDPDAAPVIHELFLRRAAGQSWKELARFLDDSGVRGPYGNQAWTSAAVSKIIANRVYLGEARSGRYVNTTAHEPIVTAAQWHAAQGAKPGATPRNGEGALLAGLVRCASCRHLMKSDSMRDRDGSRLRLYRCRGTHAAGKCPAPANVLARVLEPSVEARFLAALRGEGDIVFEASASSAELEEATRELEDAERDLALYRDDTRISDALGRDAFVAGLEVRARRVDEARGKVANASRGQIAALPDAGSLLKTWPTLSTTEKRRILAATIDAVMVRPTRGSGSAPEIAKRSLVLWRGQAPDDFPRRGYRVELRPFDWPSDA